MFSVENEFIYIQDLTLHIYSNSYNALHQDISTYDHYLPNMQKDRSASSV